MLGVSSRPCWHNSQPVGASMSFLRFRGVKSIPDLCMTVVASEKMIAVHVSGDYHRYFVSSPAMLHSGNYCTKCFLRSTTCSTTLLEVCLTELTTGTLTTARGSHQNINKRSARYAQGGHLLILSVTRHDSTEGSLDNSFVDSS